MVCIKALEVNQIVLQCPNITPMLKVAPICSKLVINHNKKR